MTDLRPPLDAPFRDFGVDATVTPKNGMPVATTVVWVGPGAEGVTLGAINAAGATTTDGRRRLRIRRDQVAALPPGSAIVAPPPEGGAAASWKVDRVESLGDLFQAVVVPS
jgi:hypothetical protein